VGGKGQVFFFLEVGRYGCQNDGLDEVDRKDNISTVLILSSFPPSLPSPPSLSTSPPS